MNRNNFQQIDPINMASARHQRDLITLSREDYWAGLQEDPTQADTADQHTRDAVDETDVTWIYPSHWGQGSIREINLREGLILTIGDYCLHNDLIISSVDREHPVELGYALVGTSASDWLAVQVGEHFLCGSGMAPGEVHQHLANQPTADLSIHIEPALLCQWCNGSDQLPSEFSHLIKPSDQVYHTQVSPTTAAMQTVIQQILSCPFQGMVQRIYLESKVWELVALELAQSSERVTARPEKVSDCKSTSQPLRPEDVERIHYAKDVLVSRLSNPPSLIELARLAGINDCKLKAGFRQVLGTTVFGYLHSCRMERSRQLLEAGEMSVAEASHAVGYANRSHFAIAFRRKFGVNPSSYRRGNLLQKLR
jgi:AraC-like DNA-binding protein